MINLTLKQLRYAESLARMGHFGRAADDCAVSQPALSMQIRELEDMLGIAVFDRGPRQVRLTPFGEIFVTEARKILRATEDLADMARAARQRLEGQMRIGIIPTLAPYLLPAIIGRLGESYPGLDLSFRETVTPRLIAELQEGKLDAALVALPAPEPALEEVDLFEEPFVLVRPEAEAERPVPGPEGLREMRLLLLEEGHCFRDQALSFCDLPSGRPREVMDGSSLATLVQMVGAGIGVTLIPAVAVPVETRSARVSVAHFPEPQPKRRIGMVWRRSSPLADQLRGIAAEIALAAQARQTES